MKDDNNFDTKNNHTENVLRESENENHMKMKWNITEIIIWHLISMKKDFHFDFIWSNQSSPFRIQESGIEFETLLIKLIGFKCQMIIIQWIQWTELQSLRKSKIKLLKGEN